MKKLLALLIIHLVWINSNFSQFSLTTAEYTQNFTIGTSNTATLPTGFKFGPDWSSGTTATTESAGTSGTGVLNNSSSGGAYNFANGVTASSTERAIGFLTSGGYSSPRSIIFAFTNNSGVTITSLSFSWNYEKYRSGSRAFNWTFHHGNTSTANTAATVGDQSYAADANNSTVFNPPLSINKKLNLTGLSIANGSSYYIRWTLTGVSGSTNGQGLGIDDLSIFANCINPVINGSSKTGLTSKCNDGTIKFYGDASGTYFAIDTASVTGGLTGETVDISIDGTAFSSNSSNGANQEHASFFMKRGWNVTAPAFTGSAKVRFYYESTDSADAVAARNADSIAKKTANPTSHLRNTPFTWFKSTNTAYMTWRSASVVGNKFTAGTYEILTPTYGSQNGVRYVEFSGITSFSGGSGGVGFGPGAGGGASGVGLPVTWAGFDAVVNADHTELLWQTASEQNTSHFEVETSIDGKEFAKISEDIPAAGNSASLLRYSYIDRDLAPIKYYRLKQVDVEGTFEYSKIIVAKRGQKADQDLEIIAYPYAHAESKQYLLILKNTSAVLSTIEVLDCMGKPVYKANTTNRSEILDLSHLTSGIYMLSVWNGGERQVVRIAL